MPRSNIMVTYQKWTQVAFEVAKSKGMRSSQENSRDLVSLAASVWRSRKPELSAATVAEARAIAGEEIHIQTEL